MILHSITLADPIRARRVSSAGEPLGAGSLVQRAAKRSATCLSAESARSTNPACAPHPAAESSQEGFIAEWRTIKLVIRTNLLKSRTGGIALMQFRYFFRTRIARDVPLCIGKPDPSPSTDEFRM